MPTISLRALWLPIVLLTVCSVPLRAQRLLSHNSAALPASFSAELPTRSRETGPTLARDSTVSGGGSKSYWKAGAIIGGVATGIYGAQLSGLCESNCSAVSTILSGLLGTLPGIVVGGLVGSLFPKH